MPSFTSRSIRTLTVPEVSVSAFISRACGSRYGDPARRRFTTTWKSAADSPYRENTSLSPAAMYVRTRSSRVTMPTGEKSRSGR